MDESYARLVGAGDASGHISGERVLLRLVLEVDVEDATDHFHL